MWGYGNQFLSKNIPSEDSLYCYFNSFFKKKLLKCTSNIIVSEYGHSAAITIDLCRLPEDLTVIMRHCHVLTCR